MLYEFKGRLVLAQQAVEEMAFEQSAEGCLAISGQNLFPEPHVSNCPPAPLSQRHVTFSRSEMQPVFLLNLLHALLQGEAPSPTCSGEGKQEVTEAPISWKREERQTFTEKSLVADTLLPEVGGKTTCRDR